MIRVTFYRKENGSLSGFCIKGHAGYGKSGRDIVCAAVSALSFNTANSIESFTEDVFSVEQGEDGYLKFFLEGNPSSDTELLLKSLLLGLSQIREEYGEKHMNIRFEEV